MHSTKCFSEVLSLVSTFLLYNRLGRIDRPVRLKIIQRAVALQSSYISREDLSGRVSYNVFSSRHNHIKKTSRDAGDRKSLYTCSIHIIVQIVRMFWRKSNRKTLKTEGAGWELYYFTLILHHYDAEEILTTGILGWEKSQHFATPPQACPQNEVWGMSAEIPYWWRVTTQI